MVRFKAWKKHILGISLLCLAVSFLVVSIQVSAEQKVQEGETVYPVPPPLVYQGLFPCQACHRKDIRGVSSELDKRSFLGKYLRAPDPRPRILVRMHRNINLAHADWMWCLNCHNIDERNYLRLISGDAISFEQSYRIGSADSATDRSTTTGNWVFTAGEWASGTGKNYTCFALIAMTLTARIFGN